MDQKSEKQNVPGPKRIRRKARAQFTQVQPNPDLSQDPDQILPFPDDENVLSTMGDRPTPSAVSGVPEPAYMYEKRNRNLPGTRRTRRKARTQFTQVQPNPDLSKDPDQILPLSDDRNVRSTTGVIPSAASGVPEPDPWKHAPSRTEPKSSGEAEDWVHQKSHSSNGTPSESDEHQNSEPVFRSKSAVYYSLVTQMKIHSFSSICHGLLGGFGLAHFILMCGVVHKSQEITAFASVYSAVAMPFQAMFFCLSALCFLSTLDKCSFFNLYDIYLTIIIKPSLIVILVVHGVTLFLSCLTRYWDLELVASSNNSTLDKDLSIGVTWSVLSLLRCVGAMLGYVLNWLFPSNDLTLGQLYNLQALELGSMKTT